MVKLLSCLFPDEFSFDLIFGVESRHALLFVLQSPFGIGFADDLAGDIDLRLEGALRLLRVEALQLLPLLALALDKSLLPLVEVDLLLFPVSRGRGELREVGCEGVFPIYLLRNVFKCLEVSLFGPLSRMSIQSLTDVFCASLLFPLDLEQLLTVPVDHRLEGDVLVLSLALHPQFHQLFVLLSLQVLHSFVDGRLVLEFVVVDGGPCAFGHQLRLEGAGFELLVVEFPLEFLPFFAASVCLVSESLDGVDVLLSFARWRPAHRGLEGADLLELALLFLLPHSVSLLLHRRFRLRQLLPPVFFAFFLLLLEGFVDVRLERALLFELPVLIQKGPFGLL